MLAEHLAHGHPLVKAPEVVGTLGGMVLTRPTHPGEEHMKAGMLCWQA